MNITRQTDTEYTMLSDIKKKFTPLKLLKGENTIRNIKYNKEVILVLIAELWFKSVTFNDVWKLCASLVDLIPIGWWRVLRLFFSLWANH